MIMNNECLSFLGLNDKTSMAGFDLNSGSINCPHIPVLRRNNNCVPSNIQPWMDLM